MHVIGNLSPEYPLHRIVDIEVIPGWGVVKITLSGTIDGVRNWYTLPGSM